MSTLLERARAVCDDVERLADEVDAELAAIDERCRGLSDDDAQRIQAEAGAPELIRALVAIKRSAAGVTGSEPA